MTETLTATPQTPTDGQSAAPAAPESVKTPVAAAPEGTAKPAIPEGQTDASAPKPLPPGLVTEPVKGETPAAAPKAPEKYEWKAEGVSPGVLAAYEKEARANGLSQDAAQKMLDSLRVEVKKSTETQHETIIRGWADQLSAHPTLGGDKLEQNLAEARKALAEFGSPELREVLDKTGLQYHPGIVEFLHKVQQKVGGDRIHTGSPGPGALSENDRAKKFYASMES